MKRTREGFAEHLRNLFALSLAHETMIYIYAGEAVSNGLVDQRRATEESTPPDNASSTVPVSPTASRMFRTAVCA